MSKRSNKYTRYSLVLIFFVLQLSSFQTIANDEDIWNDVKAGNSFVILRHALAPGTGDPENFDLTQCKTQRNLSAEGTQQAKRIGETLKAHGIDDAAVYSSQWCRCIDTANAMNIKRPEPLPLLNSFYENRERGPAQTQELLQWLKTLDTQKPVILVTHQVVISALTGVFPASGEAVVFTLNEDTNRTDGEVRVDVVHRMLVR